MRSQQHDTTSDAFAVLSIGGEVSPPPQGSLLRYFSVKNADQAAQFIESGIDYGLVLVLIHGPPDKLLPMEIREDGLSEWEYVTVSRSRGCLSFQHREQQLRLAESQRDPHQLWRIIEWMAADSLCRRFGFVTGLSSAMVAVCKRIEAAASELVDRYRLAVLLLGETGSGKGRAAEAIHRLSQRRSGPFVRVDCPSIPDTLFESEFFGAHAGAFTGSIKSRPGLATSAQGGTLFLDEIGDLGSSAQPKLLRFLDDRTVTPLGTSSPTPVDVKLVAGTNRSLSKSAGGFRADLYARLQGIEIHLPRLAERPDSIPFLIEHFIRRADSELFPHHIGEPHQLLLDVDHALDSRAPRLMTHPWPGNIRELEFAVYRSALLTRGASTRAAFWTELNRCSRTSSPDPSESSADGMDFLDIDSLSEGYDGALRRLESAATSRLFSLALEAARGSHTKAMKLLGLSKTRYYELRKRFALP